MDEIAVKSAKIMENVGPNSELQNNKILQALLTHTNTSDYGCKLSHVQILLGCILKDSLSLSGKKYGIQ